MHQFFLYTAWFIGSVAVAFTSLLLVNSLAKKGCYSDFSPRQKKRTRHD